MKNPYLALYELSKRSKYLLLSTKVFDTIDNIDVKNLPIAYFYEAYECNNDPTNYWCFTDKSLKRLITRSGWEIIAYKRVGSTEADPVILEKDGRAFAYLKSKNYNERLSKNKE